MLLYVIVHLLGLQNVEKLTCNGRDSTAITRYTKVTRGYNLHFTHQPLPIGLLREVDDEILAIGAHT